MLKTNPEKSRVCFDHLTCTRLKTNTFDLGASSKIKIPHTGDIESLDPDADRRTDKILERLRDLSLKKNIY